MKWDGTSVPWFAKICNEDILGFRQLAFTKREVTYPEQIKSGNQEVSIDIIIAICQFNVD